MFFKATIGISLDDRPVSAIYIISPDEQAIRKAFAEKDIPLFSFDQILKIEEVDEEEVQQNCCQSHIKMTKRQAERENNKAFHIDSKKIF